jgi:hypothetical protein
VHALLAGTVVFWCRMPFAYEALGKSGTKHRRRREIAGTMTNPYRTLLFEFFVVPAVALVRRLVIAVGWAAQEPKLKVGK